ncbi:DUF3575 domain-containing protein [Solirubrum puertoriconensis]|uniref:DUF3575 domain-containing protein n=1 Tax=Solirubrum puertoriconensis TaxID=1751427 RepID=A0A9X0HIY7_SOLP1|nr:DUF3575 domain-containing protein [Solirubrum puertoriconensis]KUG06760.1 hypothetical protein ASU33_05360 [Solirubrum puertoriconensis]
MKKTLLCLAVLLSAHLGHAQKTVVKINTVSLLYRTASVLAERQVHPAASVQLGMFYTPNTGKMFDDRELSGFGITPEVRFYTSGIALQGFYLGLYTRYQHFQAHEDIKQSMFPTRPEDNNLPGRPIEGSINAVGLGMTAGYQFALTKRLRLDPFVGLGFNIAFSNVTTPGFTNHEFYTARTHDGAEPRLGLAVGYAF